ncbi:hypothetical protein HK096_006325 [Nowakowskiella sp. JEL0078]|nr:hypothetical protein HK096_006325 [Nowakowskiella sp. JEL0078]
MDPFLPSTLKLPFANHVCNVFLCNYVSTLDSIVFTSISHLVFNTSLDTTSTTFEVYAAINLNLTMIKDCNLFHFKDPVDISNLQIRLSNSKFIKSILEECKDELKCLDILFADASSSTISLPSKLDSPFISCLGDDLSSSFFVATHTSIPGENINGLDMLFDYSSLDLLDVILPSSLPLNPMDFQPNTLIPLDTSEFNVISLQSPELNLISHQSPPDYNPISYYSPDMLFPHNSPTTPQFSLDFLLTDIHSPDTNHSVNIFNLSSDMKTTLTANSPQQSPETSPSLSDLEITSPVQSNESSPVVDSVDLPSRLPFSCNWQTRQTDLPITCAQLFDTQEEYNDHILEHTTKAKDEMKARNPVACGWEGCTYVTEKPYHFDRHMTKHLKIRAFVCEKGCVRTFSTRESYRRHMKKRHSYND